MIYYFKDIINSNSCYGTVTDLVRGSLRTWHIYIDVASRPSLAPQLNILVNNIPIV